MENGQYVRVPTEVEAKAGRNGAADAERLTRRSIGGLPEVQRGTEVKIEALHGPFHLESSKKALSSIRNLGS
jgi:hypothetical protein